MKIKISLLIMVIFFLSFSGNVSAEDPSMPTSENPPTLQDIIGRINLSVPESPAFVALGVTPENVIRPGTGKELALGLLNGVDGNGNFQAGIAIEAAPYLLAKGNSLEIKEYRTDFVKRTLSRMQVSFATASGQSDTDDAEKISIGLRWTLWDQGDKRLDDKLITCYNEKISWSEVPPTTIGEDTSTGTRKPPEDVEKAAVACVQEAEKRLWNANSWDIGLAGYTIDDETTKETGFSYWSSLALRFTKNGQFILHGRYYEDLLSEDINSDGIMDLQNGFIASARLRLGIEKVALLLEGSYTDLDYDNLNKKDNYYDIMIGTEFYLMKGLWIQLAIGDRQGSDIPNDTETYLSGQLRWGLSKISLR